MSATPPDPAPDESTGLTPGGSVPPGETPPGEASSTGGVSRKQPDVPSSGASKAVYAAVVIVALLVVVMLVAYAVGIMG